MKSFLALTAILLAGGTAANACSISVNDLYQRNLLVGLAAGEMNVDLAAATLIQVDHYSKLLTGAATPSSCPTHLETQERVRIKYKKKSMNCQMSVVVRRRVQIADELVAGPFESISTSSASNVCSF